MAMNMLSQINILDIKTKKLVGVRMANTPDFKDLEKQTEGFRYYYNDIGVDNEYIYGLYSNLPLDVKNFPFSSNEIHVFNWEGKPVRKIILKDKVDRIAIDPIKKKMYTKNTNDEIFCFDIK